VHGKEIISGHLSSGKFPADTARCGNINARASNLHELYMLLISIGDEYHYWSLHFPLCSFRPDFLSSPVFNYIRLGPEVLKVENIDVCYQPCFEHKPRMRRTYGRMNSANDCHLL
jgi:hypothetical protein